MPKRIDSQKVIVAEPDRQPRGLSNRVACRQMRCLPPSGNVVIARGYCNIQRAAEAKNECMPEAMWEALLLYRGDLQRGCDLTSIRSEGRVGRSSSTRA